MILIVIIFYLLLFWFDVWELKRHGEKKMFVISIFLFLLSFSVACLLTLGIKIPSPSKPIVNIIQNIFGG